MRSTTYNPAGTIFEGIDAFGAAVRTYDIRVARARYRQVAPQLRAVIKPGDTCLLAFAATATNLTGALADDLRGDTRGCFVAILHDRLVVAWHRCWLPALPAAVIVVDPPPTTVTVERSEPAFCADRVTVSHGAAESRLRITIPPGTADLVRDALSQAADASPATPIAPARNLGKRP